MRVRVRVHRHEEGRRQAGVRGVLQAMDGLVPVVVVAVVVGDTVAGALRVVVKHQRCGVWRTWVPGCNR